MFPAQQELEEDLFVDRREMDELLGKNMVDSQNKAPRMKEWQKTFMQMFGVIETVTFLALLEQDFEGQKDTIEVKLCF